MKKSPPGRLSVQETATLIRLACDDVSISCCSSAANEQLIKFGLSFISKKRIIEKLTRALQLARTLPNDPAATPLPKAISKLSSSKKKK